MSPATTPGYNSGSGIEQNTGNITRPNAAQLIATEVVDFGVRLYERASGGTLREVFPCRRDVNGTPEAGQSTKTPPFSYAASTRAPGPHPHGGLALLLGNIDCGYPAVAEIFIRILTPQGFTMIQTYEEEDAGRFPGQTWWSIVEQHSQVFTRRVVLLVDPL
ncbi:hypothetical protein Ga0100231_001310 [Opitutaceae bacterium TAV4]|nr:hypothetical protein Ga0100231_001310 [Opitutaceae bacterium TAV4]RRK01572.1 hypothetical protein Ga0100230_006875 [Opitutaceae bacterium TAV3]